MALLHLKLTLLCIVLGAFAFTKAEWRSGSNADDAEDGEYEVQEVTFFPDNSEYWVGDQINCTADGNPEPSYRWIAWETKSSTTEVFGSRLDITDDMRDPEDPSYENIWICVATNGIGYGSSYWAKSFTIIQALGEEYGDDDVSIERIPASGRGSKTIGGEEEEVTNQRIPLPGRVPQAVVEEEASDEGLTNYRIPVPGRVPQAEEDDDELTNQRIPVPGRVSTTIDEEEVKDEGPTNQRIPLPGRGRWGWWGSKNETTCRGYKAECVESATKLVRVRQTCAGTWNRIWSDDGKDNGTDREERPKCKKGVTYRTAYYCKKWATKVIYKECRFDDFTK